ncbi:MAG: iron ABC transporter permease [Saprospiraceae bacterium]|nr:iron ABC transporter permease [Saprospiraceae bacterium]
MLFSLSHGAFRIEPLNVIKILANQVYSINPSWSTEDELILLQVRLPRIILVVLVGANLAVSGTILQAIFKNPLVSPFILGISSGASLGASIVIVFFNFYSFYILQLSAFTFSIIAVLIVLLITRICNSQNTTILVLAGVVTSSFFQAIVSLLQYFSESDKLQSIVYWNFGSFTNASWNSVLQVVPFTIIGIMILFLNSWRINVLSLGDEESTALGLNTQRYRFGIIVIVSLLTSTATAVTGPIGWVGLIIPHIVRMTVGSNKYFVILGSIGLGSAFMLLVDFFARTTFNFELPVGIVTSIIGVPFFIFILYRTNNQI